MNSNEANFHRILIPVYDDWECCGILLRQLDETLVNNGMTAEVVIVNDHSKRKMPSNFPGSFEGISNLRILHLNGNLGHQRAIAVGMTKLSESREPSMITVMDADGEDDPSDVPCLIRHLQEHPEYDAVFAARRRRSESALFCVGYQLYRLMHLILTGVPVRFGNLSTIRGKALNSLCRQPGLWNHYAAALVRSDLSYGQIPTSRKNRYAGESHMNVMELILHGFRALSVFVDLIVCRLFLFTGFVSLLMLGWTGTFGWRYFVPCILGLGLWNAFFLMVVLSTVSSRSLTQFVPATQALNHLGHEEMVFPLETSP